MLELNNVNVMIGERDILKDISFSLSKGETLSIIGPSGCGKSTLLLSVAELRNIDNGEIKDGSKDKGLILQNHGLFPWKTIRQNIALGLIARSVSKNKIKILVEDIAKELGINHLLDSYPKSVSGGERQRAEVARVLVYNPDLLLMDEPSSALDSINKERFQNLLIKIQEKYNLTYIIVTHNIEEAVFLGERIAVMRNGKIAKIVENLCYGKSDIRKDYEFFNKCNEIRGFLEEGGID